MIKRDSINPARSSYLPCPKGCSSSAGSEDFETEKKAIKEAIKSPKECIASETTETLPLIKPTTIFRIIKEALDTMEVNAASFFSKPALILTLPLCLFPNLHGLL